MRWSSLGWVAMPNPAKIAAKLTKGERKVLSLISEGLNRRPRYGTIPWRAVMLKGLSEWQDYEQQTQELTELGLAVRAHLEQADDQG